MKNLFGRYKVIGTCLLISVLIAVVCNVLTLIQSPLIVNKVAAVYGLVGCILALQYMLKGYGKRAAKAYKLFMLVLCFSYQCATISPALVTKRIGADSDLSVALTVGAHCMLAAFAMALAVGENTGEKLSKFMGIVMIGTSAFMLALLCMTFPGVVRGGSIIGTAVVLRAGANLIMAQIAFAMIQAKYRDKNDRAK